MLNETQNILNRLAVADRTHQKEAGGKLLLRNAKFVCAAVLVGFVLDVIFHLGAGWRLGLLLVLIAGVIILAFFAWHRAFVRRNRVEHIARFLETRDPSLGSRLINLLQLNEQARDASLAPLTRDLARQAVENYAAGLRTVPVENIARTDEVRGHLKRAAWVLLGFTAVLAICFQITATEVARFVDPFGDHPPYSFTSLAIVQPGPGGTTVAYGKGLIVKVKAAGHQPKEVFITSYPPGHPEQAVTLPMFDEGGVGFNQQLDNVHTDLVVFAHTKDRVSESKQVRVAVVLTPRLEKAFVRIAPPDYTNLKPEEKPYDFKGVQALEGSGVQFRIESNRPLREGLLEITDGDQPPQRIVLKKSGDNEVTGSFVAADSGRLRFGVVDESGLPSQGGHEAGLTVTHDLPPEIHITNPEHDSAVAMDFKLQAQIEGSDDYGLSEIRLHRGVNGVYSAPQVFKYDKARLDSRETTDFNFAEMGVHPGDVITLFAEAVDNAPQPHLSRSQTVHLTVISVEDYNNFLREQSDISNTEAKYAGLNNDLQDLMDQQKELGEAAQKLSEQLAKADAKQKQALAGQLDGLVAQQNELNQKLNQQAARMDNFVRQTPVYDIERDLQDLLRQQAQSVRESTQANDAATKDIAQRSSPPSGPRQLSPEMLNDLKAASDKQVTRLSQTHEDTDKQVVQPLEDMSRMQELVKDFNRFESLYKSQLELTQQTQAYNRPGKLGREDQLALKDIAANEQEVGQALHELRTKLGDDSRAAQKLFPKASRSGEDLADQIGGNLMEPLAERATGQMLAGNGDQSFQLADRLRLAMEKLFGECQGGNCPSGDELDSYLRLQRLMPGGNFAQMARSRRFGTGMGHGIGGGSGEGAAGSSGYAVMDGASMGVLGNESFAGKDASRQSGRNGRSGGAQIAGAKGDAEKPDVIDGLNPVNRHSAANSPETPIEEYNDIVDNYFKAIATKKEKPANDKSN
jgi:hypothetical protein